MTSRDVRIEQCIAFGRSTDWIRDNLGCDNNDIRSAYQRIAAAHGGVDLRYATSSGVDEGLIDAIIDGTVVIPTYRGGNTRTLPPELVEAVRRLTERGLTDAQISRIVHRTRDAVRSLRKRHGIEPGIPVNRAS